MSAYHDNIPKASFVSPVLSQLMKKANIPVGATVPNITWESAHALRVSLSEYIIHTAKMMSSQVADLQGVLRPFVHPERWNELAIVTKALKNDIEEASKTAETVGSLLWDRTGAVLETELSIYTRCTHICSDTTMKSQSLFLPALLTISSSVTEALVNQAKYQTGEAYAQALNEGRVTLNRVTQPFTTQDADAIANNVGITPINQVQVL